MAEKLGVSRPTLYRQIELYKSSEDQKMIESVREYFDMLVMGKIQTEDEARKYILERSVDGREGFFCLTSNLDYNPNVIRKMYRDKDCVEKLFSSMKSDIGIRPIRAWTDDAVHGVLVFSLNR